MRLNGLPVTLGAYPASSRTNRQFRGFDLAGLDRIYLPPALSGLADEPPASIERFLEDDNRGAISPDPVATLDGIPFHLSVKGIGSTVDPYSSEPLDRRAAGLLTDDERIRTGLSSPRIPHPLGEPERIITGELWLRGSPYGGQGLPHASIALSVSERAELTSLAGFLIAPVVKVVEFPPDLEERLLALHWYRRFRGHLAQELRLVPSNFRIYFNAKNTVGNDVRHIFDIFGIASEAQALECEVRFIRSVVAMLTLFARSLRRETSHDRYLGLDLHDVWLDKDAVLAPNGSVYFVDLEGIEEVDVDRSQVRERIEDQVYRSLYEFMFAYEQIDRERRRRFGRERSRKGNLVALVGEALRDDPFVRVRKGPAGTELEIRNALFDEGLYTRFPLVDR